MPRLTYIGQAPTEGTGSPIIILRHLRRLMAAGWEITVIPEAGQNTVAAAREGWKIARLPHRRLWWPPYRQDQSISRFVRTWLLGGECRRLTRASPPDAILGYLAAHADFSTEVAVRFARRSGKPISLLIHDDAAAFATDPVNKARLRRRHGALLRQAHRCLFVSPELAEAYDVPASARHVLFPSPEGWSRPAEWRPALTGRPLVCYAGHIWPPQYPLLGKIARLFDAAGARLVLLAKATSELKAFAASGAPVELLPPFPTNREALEYLVGHVSGLLVSYTETVAEMPWIETSFPSKLIEYAHLGLPCAIVAPVESSVGRWAERNQFPDFFPPTELERLSAWARALGEEAAWRGRRESVRHLAENQFSPEKIQTVFVSHLLRP